MKKREPVSKIMTKDLISINQTHKISDVVQIFKERNIHHIPVVSGSKLLGIISRSDIDKISYRESDQAEGNTAVYNMLKIDQVMTRQVETVQSDDQIKEAAELLARGRYHALPVMEGDKIAGIVTSTDIINYLLEQY